MAGTMTRDRERRTVIILWLTVLLLTVGTFAADAFLRHETCVSAIVVDANGTTSWPVYCE